MYIYICIYIYIYVYIYINNGSHHRIYDPPKIVVPNNPRYVWEVKRVARESIEKIMGLTWINRNTLTYYPESWGVHDWDLTIQLTVYSDWRLSHPYPNISS